VVPDAQTFSSKAATDTYLSPRRGAGARARRGSSGTLDLDRLMPLNDRPDPELRRLSPNLQASLHARLPAEERLWCTLDGGRAVLAATDRAAYLHDGRDGHPDWERLDWAAILDVSVTSGERTAVLIRRRGGRPVLFTARRDGGEAFLQCATILNLLAIRARRVSRSPALLPSPDA
jgi:hypothetical protein